MKKPITFDGCGNYLRKRKMIDVEIACKMVKDERLRTMKACKKVRSGLIDYDGTPLEAYRAACNDCLTAIKGK